MLRPITTRQFEKDITRLRKRGRDLEKLFMVVRQLADEEILAEQYRDHALAGNYKGRRECHIEPNWLLIYQVTGDAIIFERSGTHSDLFE